MVCFFYLLLGHLLGDFTLQTNKIAENKVKSRQYNVLHAIIVTLCMLLFSIPFGWLVMVMVFINGIVHYFLDYFKPKLSASYPLPGIVWFLFDQLAHIVFIYLISVFAVVNIHYLLFGREQIKILLVLVFVSSFAAVLNQYIIGLALKGSGDFFKEDEKSMGNLARICLTFGLYLSVRFSLLFLLIIAAVVFIQIYHYRVKWHIWMDLRRFFSKLLMDSIISLAGFSFLLFI